MNTSAILKNMFLWSMLIQCLISFGQPTFKEQLYVHTNKPSYHAGELMWFRVYCVEGNSHKPSPLSKFVYVQLFDTSGNSILSGVFPLVNGAGHGSFELPAGMRPQVYSLWAYTRWMKNFPAEEHFSQPVVINNAYVSDAAIFSAFNNRDKAAGELNIEVKLPGQSFRKRDRVSLSLAALNKQKQKIEADLSVSVYRIDTSTQRQVLINFRPSGTGSEFKYRFPPEYRGQWITANIIDKNTGKPAADVPAYLAVPGYASGFYNAKSDSTGRIAFELNGIVQGDSLLIVTKNLPDRSYLVRADNPFLEKTLTNSHNSITGAAHMFSSLRNAVEVQRSFHPDLYQPLISFETDSVPFYGKFDLLYQLDDYTRFPRMEEVFREYVQLVSVHKRNGRFHLSVFNEPYQKSFDSDPLVLLDGYPVLDINRLFEFDPLKVKSVEVVTRRYFRGSEAFDGIISLSTYSHNLNSFPIDSHALVLKNLLPGKRRYFDSPVYTTDAQRNSRIPDFRNVLVWAPSLITNVSGEQMLEFYTSDLPGTYIVEVNGIAADGQFGSSFQFFDVR